MGQRTRRAALISRPGRGAPGARRRPGGVAAGLTLLGLTLGWAAPGHAQSCLVTTPIGPGNDIGTAIALQSDGKIVQGGYISNGSNDDFVLVRYGTGLDLDRSFDVDGVVVTPIGTGADQAEAVAIQPNGKILLAGFSHNGANNDFAIVRYNRDGSLDTTWGGTGKVVTPVGTGHDEIEGIAVQPDGKVVVAGLTNSGSDDHVVARYNSNGTLDTAGFNSGGCSPGPPGIAISPIGVADFATAVALQSDGKIVVVGQVQPAGRDFFVARYDTNGCLDTGFDTDGWASADFRGETDTAYAVVIQPADQKIVVAGGARSGGWTQFAVARFNPTGTLDGTFNPGATLPLVPGQATVDFTGVHDDAFGLDLQGDGRIVMGGAAGNDGGGTNVNMALTRHTTTGLLDTATFNPGGALPPLVAGTITTDVASNNDWIDAVAVQGDGKIVAAGYSRIGTTDDLVVARYNSDGSLATDCGVPVHHRSLGMALDYSIGTVTATTGSAVVTGSGTSWQGQNRGRGDRITIDGTDYTILWVDSNTSLRLTSVFNGVSGTGKGYTIGREFQDPADGKVVVDAWMACIDGSVACPGVSSGDLVADNRREVAVVYDDGFVYVGPFDGRLMQINSVTTDAQHDITVTADGPNRHYGISGAGVQFRLAAGSTGGDVIEVLDRWVTIEWLEVFGDQAGNDAIEVTDTATPGGVTLRYNLIHDTGAGIQVQDAFADVDLYNNIIHSTGKWGIDIDQPLVGLRIFNNTVYDCTDEGVHTVAAGPYPTVLLKNNIVLGAGPPDYDVPGHDPASSNNFASDGTGTTHSDAGGGVNDLSASESTTVCGDPDGCVGFAAITGTVNLHLISTTYTNRAVNAGVNLNDVTPEFDVDIELRRVGAWDVGADELGGTTAVELLSFEAAGAESAVDLAWRTGSELDNLGFHVYRGPSSSGPWVRITPSLIPGLGSSPEGASYSLRDTGLTNGALYFYLLEDVDTASVSTLHGPISAVPRAAAPPGGESGPGEPAPSGGGDPPPETGTPEPGGEGSPPGDDPCPACPRAYGDPAGSAFRIVSRSATGMRVELRTPGFVATPSPAGALVTVPGFDEPSDPAAPALPLKRALLDGVVGRSARVVSAEVGDVLSFTDLTPAAVGEPAIDVAADGTVRAHWWPVALDTSSGGVLPEESVRIASSAFLGETKKLTFEMSPLRYDTATGELLLARTLTAEIAFDGAPTAFETGSGSKGRRPPRSLRRGAADVLAYLHTTEAGLYSVSFDALFPARQRPIPLSSLKLSLAGHPVPFHVEPASRLFRSGSRLVFFAAEVASSTDHSAETSHVLERGRGGVRMGIRSGAPVGDPVSLAPLALDAFETNRIYQAGLLEAPDIWLWEGANGGASRTVSFSLEGVDPLSPLPVRLRVFLQGASDSGTPGEHHVSVALNGVALGNRSFEAKLPFVFEKAVDVSALLEGENTLTLQNVGDTGVYSLVFLDRVEVLYPQTPELRGGRLEGEFSESGVATITGSASVAVDVTDSLRPVWLSGLETLGGAVRLETVAGHRYVVASLEGLRAPRISSPRRSGLENPAIQADYVLIAPGEYMEAARPLLERREDQGLSTYAASFEEVAERFGHGTPSARAIRDFLAFAFHSWQSPSPRYVVLLGDASYDPRNFTGVNRGAPLPAHWTKTSYMWTASDPMLAAVNGDDPFPDIALGRLPATTVEEAEALVRKVLDWEDSGQGLGGPVVLVADNPDEAGDFEADLEDIRASVLVGRSTQTLKIREFQGETRGAILGAFDSGASLMSYAGHGGAAVWASENVLNSWDAPSLLAQSQQPLMLTMNCLNGYFVAPNYDALAEAFLKAEGRGTIAALSPSGLSLEVPAHQFHRALMDELVNGEHERLGDAVLAAQAAYAETGLMPELLEIYHLLGDPGMTIR